MALKMRFLYFSGKAKMKALAECVKQEFELTQNHNAVDVIPPAYGCENERLVVIGVTGKGEPDDILRRFCLELSKKNANNVALVIDGDERLGNNLVELLQSVGTNVMSDVLYVKLGGLPIFGSKPSEDEKKVLLDWMHNIVNNIQ